MEEGWIKLYRKLQSWEWYQDSPTVHLFIHLLINANHRPNRWKGVEIGRGQLVTGLQKLQEKTGISRQTLRSALQRLISTHEITRQSTHRFSLITVCNYESYQSAQDATNTPANTLTNTLPTHCQHAANTKQECKKERTPKGQRTYVRCGVNLRARAKAGLTPQRPKDGRPTGPNGHEWTPFRAGTPRELELLALVRDTLGVQWVENSGMWGRRIFGSQAVPAELDRVQRVFAEVRDAVRCGRIQTTAGQYAQHCWAEFASRRTGAKTAHLGQPANSPPNTDE